MQGEKEEKLKFFPEGEEELGKSAFLFGFGVSGFHGFTVSGFRGFTVSSKSGSLSLSESGSIHPHSLTA
jgi:hypothetical protein